MCTRELGIVDVVPFVALEPSTFEDALRARNEFARFAADELGGAVFFSMDQSAHCPTFANTHLSICSPTLDQQCRTPQQAQYVLVHDRF